MINLIRSLGRWGLGTFERRAEPVPDAYSGRGAGPLPAVLSGSPANLFGRCVVAADYPDFGLICGDGVRSAGV